MKFLFTLLLSILPFSAASFATVQIEEVGVQGYYSTASPTSVRIRVSNVTHAGPVRLEVEVIDGGKAQYGPLRTDHYSLIVNVKTNDDTEVDVPVDLIFNNGSELQIVATDSAGQSAGSSSLDLNSSSPRGTQYVVLILCRERKICDEAQTQINFSGTPQDVTNKNAAMRFVTTDALRSNWWDYSAANFVVIAESTSDWTSEQRQALEYYVRGGGKSVLLEKEIADPTLFSSYRQGPAKSEPVAVGRGELYRVAQLSEKTLGSVFVSKSPWPTTDYSRQSNPLQWLRDEVGVSFTFPRFRWLLIWLDVYILIVGLVNFLLLQRIKRLEWGWFSTSVIAVAFAFALYMAATANRPKKVTLDNVAVYWMDAHSNVAAEDIGLRISSPSRQQINLAVGDSALLLPQFNQPNAATADLARELFRNGRSIQPGSNVDLGPPLQTEVPLLRWSLKDLNLQTMHVFPGSVTLSNDLHLRNNTGQYFKQALYFDFPSNRLYLIPQLGPGAEIDINTCSSEAINYKTGQQPINLDSRPTLVVTVIEHSGSKPLKDLGNNFNGNGAKHVFVGLSDSPVPPVDLSIGDTTRNNVALTIVSLD
ncbi:MAG TPA: hypothetical protein VGN39_18750 [Terriglobales bacterium]|jgi:hypothetical protein|nr:hypothetical protein [Terriglobales bacterium]